ncbi:MAG TPA: hypothetical protein DHV55_16790, partial [Clostridiaceae bacterium]|nr:hypothetical protein [Clostridiaceae bacterium]
IAITLGNMLMFFCFFRPRLKWWLYPTLVAMTYFALPMVYKLNTLLFGATTTYSVLMTCLGYWNALLVLAAFRERFWKMISLIFTLCILNRLFTFWGYILYMPLHALFGGDINIKLSITLVITIMYGVISLLCWFFLRDKGRHLIQRELRRHNWVVLAGIAVPAKLVMDFCSDYVFNLNPYSHSKLIWAMIALSNFVLAVLVLYIYSTLTTMKHLELKASAHRLAFEKEAQQRYYETQLHNQKELHRMKHDMNGNLNTISRLLSENNKDEALRYLAELSNYAESHQKALYSDDPYLNAVVANYATVLAKNDIPFQQEIQLGKMELHQVEMCLVLNNALENAMEASLKLLPEQRYVKLQVKTKQCRFLFRITNRFNNELLMEDGLPRSTKESKGHGYGLTSIRDAAESVGGFAIFKIEVDMFVLDVAM